MGFRTWGVGSRMWGLEFGVEDVGRNALSAVLST